MFRNEAKLERDKNNKKRARKGQATEADPPMDPATVAPQLVHRTITVAGQ
jgi:hypothetical protein